MERKEKIMAQPTPEPTPKKIPWEEYIPSYVEDNAKGYPKYVDKIVQYLNNSGKGGGLFTFTVEMDENEDYIIETPFSEIESAFDEGKIVIANIAMESPDGAYKDTGFGIANEKLSQHGITGLILYGCLSEDNLPDGDNDYESIMSTKVGVTRFVVAEGEDDTAVIPVFDTYFNNSGFPAETVGIQFSMTDASTITCSVSYKFIRYFVEHNTPAYGFFDTQSFTRSSTQDILNKCFTPFALYMGSTSASANIKGDMLYWDGTTAKKYTITVASDDTVTFSTSNLSA